MILHTKNSRWILWDVPAFILFLGNWWSINIHGLMSNWGREKKSLRAKRSADKIWLSLFRFPKFLASVSKVTNLNLKPWLNVELIFRRQCLTHYVSAMPFGNRNINLENIFISVFSQFQEYHPSGNVKVNTLGIFQSLKLHVLMGKSFQYLLI